MSLELFKKKLSIVKRVSLGSSVNLDMADLLRDGTLLCEELDVRDRHSFPYVWDKDKCIDTVHKAHLAKDWKKDERHVWGTYSGCKDFELSINDKGTLILKVKMYNGDNLYGERTDLRFSATFEVLSNEDIIQGIASNKIDRKLYMKAESIRQDQIEAEEHMKILAIQEDLLKEK